MKIAIITLPLHTNYGGILQAYALQTVLSRMGHDVVHLQPEIIYPPLHPWWKMPFVWGIRIYRKYLGGDRKLPVFGNPYREIRQFTDMFINSYIRCDYIEDDEWQKIGKDSYDAIIVGSDQVWRPKYANPIERYFCGMLNNTPLKRIVYAASFGTDENEYTKEQQVECAHLLQKFDAVSVREQSAVAICKERFGVEANQVLDPTMLLTPADYEALVNKAGMPPHKGNLMVYILDRSVVTDAFVEQICTHKGLKAFQTNSKVEDPMAPLSERVQPPVESWLRGFMDAEYVITDSFHACVFSILFHKPFICIGNNSRGMSRFHSLLNLFGLTNRLVDIDNSSDFQDEAIDWSVIDITLDQKRVESMQFLSAALNR